jgi:hypothetical protein
VKKRYEKKKKEEGSSTPRFKRANQLEASSDKATSEKATFYL